MAQTRKAPKTKSSGTRKAPKSSKLVPLIKQVAKSQALKVLETKFVMERNAANTFNSPINGGFSEMYSLIPLLNQGTGTYQRLDDSVQPLNIRTNWHIALGTANRSMNIRCVLYCLQHKSIKHYPDLNVYTSGPPFLKSGQATLTQGYEGRIQSENLPIDTQEFTLLKCFKFNLMANVGVANGDTTDGNSPNTLPSFKNLSYTYKCKRQLKYDASAPPMSPALYPNGHAPFWVFGYAHTDGTSPDIINQDVNISWMTQMTYKDA